MTSAATITLSNTDEIARRARLLELLRCSPIPDAELQSNLGLFINRQTMSRFLFIQEVYQRILNVHGAIAEFGVRWGQNLALFSMLRGIYEPFNYNRRIIGFDSFSGFPSVASEDGQHPAVRAGAYAVGENYEAILQEILHYHESESPISHLRKFELVKGDARLTIPDYLKAHPETIFSLAYFDFDLYEPTKLALEYVIPRMPKGGVIVFDELNYANFPGETRAVQEIIGIQNLRLQRSPLSGNASYAIVE